jgi:hypothetical protein
LLLGGRNSGVDKIVFNVRLSSSDIGFRGRRFLILGTTDGVDVVDALISGCSGCGNVTKLVPATQSFPADSKVFSGLLRT